MLFAIQRYFKKRRQWRDNQLSRGDERLSPNFLRMRGQNAGIIQGEALYRIAKGIDSKERPLERDQPSQTAQTPTQPTDIKDKT